MGAGKGGAWGTQGRDRGKHGAIQAEKLLPDGTDTQRGKGGPTLLKRSSDSGSRLCTGETPFLQRGWVSSGTHGGVRT